MRLLLNIINTCIRRNSPRPDKKMDQRTVKWIILKVQKQLRGVWVWPARFYEPFWIPRLQSTSAHQKKLKNKTQKNLADYEVTYLVWQILKFSILKEHTKQHSTKHTLTRSSRQLLLDMQRSTNMFLTPEEWSVIEII